jgi:hypothetical protein
VVVFHSIDDELRRHVEDLPFAVVGDPDQALYREFGVRSSPRSRHRAIRRGLTPLRGRLQAEP